MEICVKDESKTVEIWLTRNERDDPAVRASLKPVYAAYKEKKYLVATFLSGDRELYQQTADLLCYNRKRVAQREVAQERQQGITMSI